MVPVALRGRACSAAVVSDPPPRGHTSAVPPEPERNPTQSARIVLDIMHCRMHIEGMKRAAKTGDPKVAVAYLRVSTQEQDLGPEAQRAAIEAWAERQGVRVVSYFEDRLSGGTKVEDRPAMLQAFGALRASGAGLLVAAKRDRIARDVVVAATVEQMAREAGAKVVTADGVAVEDTPEGMLLRGLMDLFAQYERAVIRARTRAALAVIRSKGEQYTRRAPLGFRFEDGRLVEDPAGARDARPRPRHEGPRHLDGPGGVDPQRRGPPVPRWPVARHHARPRAPEGRVVARPVVGAAKDKQLVVRLSSDLRARLERVREALSKRAGGVDLVTSHVVREVIERGLDSIERDLARK